MRVPVIDPPQLLQRVSDELLQRVQYFSVAPQCVLALGAGAATLMPQLQRRFPKARLLLVDRAEAGLRAVSARRSRWLGPKLARIRGMPAELPLRSGSVELILSHLMLPACREPQHALQELARVLKPNGLLVLAALGPDTLQELPAAAQPETSVPSGPPYLDAPYIDLHRLGEALMQAGLARPVMDVEHYALHYPDARGVPATVEVVFAAAFGAGPSAGERPESREAAEIAVPLSSLKVRRDPGSTSS